MKSLLLSGLLLLTAHSISGLDDDTMIVFPDAEPCFEPFSARLILALICEETSAVDKIRDIIVGELGLLHLQYKIAQAMWIEDEGLLFEMNTPEAASEVIAQFRKVKELGGTKLQSIESTVKDFSGNKGNGRSLEIGIDIRSGAFIR